MPGLKLFRKNSYANTFANEPVGVGTIKLGCTRGKGSSTRMFNYCKQHSPNPSDCINQFITIINPQKPYNLGNWKKINKIKLNENISSSSALTLSENEVSSTNYNLVEVNPIQYGVGNWFQILTNNTGNYVTAIDSNILVPGLYVSSDGGDTFTLNTTQYHNYSGISTTNSGNYIFSPAIRDLIFLSNDYGSTFNTTSNPGGFWYKVASNSTGQIVAIFKNFNNSDGETGNPIFISTNYASSFTSSISSFYSWSDIAMNDKGNVIAVCSYDGHLYLTTNQGKTWSSISVPAYCWSGISIDKTGSNIVLCSLDGYIYVSNNTGRTFNSVAPSNLKWSSICISSNANVIFACAINDYIYYSSNNGSSWKKTNPSGTPSNWSSISTNNTGTLVCACVNGGNIYINS